jgi:serine/threonine-protein kinase
VLGGDVGARADLFALGVVLWEWMTHRRLLKAERDLDVVRKVLEEPIASPSSVRPLPPELDAVTMRMLDRDASQRFASCADAAKALDLIASRQVGGDLSPADFMRQLGTDDLVVKTRSTPHSAGNFVISLKAPSAGSAHVETVGAPTSSPAARGRSGRPWVIGAAVVAILVIAGGLIVGGRVRELEILPPVVVTPLEQPLPPPPVVAAPVVVPPPVVADPVPAVATLSIETTPSRATLRVDGKPVGLTPHELQLTAGQPHYVLVEKAGYRRIEQEVTLEPGAPKSLSLKLEPLDARRPPPVQPVVVATPSAPGFLTVNTVPWTKVAVDGEPIGSIPIASKKLTPGRHQLELVNEGAGISDKRFIDIKSGETLKLNLTLK